MSNQRSRHWLNATLCGLALFFLALLATTVLKFQPYLGLRYWVWAFLGILAAVHLVALGLSRDVKLTVMMAGLSAVAGLYLGELALELSGYTVREVMTDHLRIARIEKARAAGVPFDQRSRLQVILDERKLGHAAYSGMAGHKNNDNGGITLPDGRKVYAFGGLSGVRVVDCNETGSYSTYVADEKGFNNPLGLWERDDIEIVTLGGSFVHGACLPREKTMVGQIRRLISPRTLNLSATGPAPVEDYARLAEFGPRLKPRLILWFFYEQFIFSAQREALKNRILKSYLDTPAPRGVYDLTAEIDRVLLAEHDKLMADAIRNVGKPKNEHYKFYEFGLRNLLSLRNVRYWLGAVHKTGLEELMTPAEIGDVATSLDRTIAQTKRIAESWGGKVVVVYINGYNRYMAPHEDWKQSFPYQTEFFDIVRRNGLPLLDLSIAFADHEDPSKLYPFGLEGHFSAAGATFAAETLKSFLDKGGYLGVMRGN